LCTRKRLDDALGERFHPLAEYAMSTSASASRTSRWLKVATTGSATSALPHRARRGASTASRALKEVIDARVWGGIHFRTADVQGAVLGKKVAHYMGKHYFQPTS